MSQADDKSKLHIDSDWKAQAQAEKRKLAEQAEKKKAAEAPAGAGARMGGAGRLPPASFDTLVRLLAQDAMMAMGAAADPRTGRVVLNLDVARLQIDLLAMLEQKTQGQLTPEEAKGLAGMLYELRQMFIAQASAQREAVRT
jgi:hypothetical protein